MVDGSFKALFLSYRFLTWMNGRFPSICKYPLTFILIRWLVGFFVFFSWFVLFAFGIVIVHTNDRTAAEHQFTSQFFGLLSFSFGIMCLIRRLPLKCEIRMIKWWNDFHIRFAMTYDVCEGLNRRMFFFLAAHSIDFCGRLMSKLTESFIIFIIVYYFFSLSTGSNTFR